MKVIISVILVFGLYVAAGTMDYSEEVVCNLPEDTLNEIKLKLGDDANCYQIAQEYKRNIEYYEKSRK